MFSSTTYDPFSFINGESETHQNPNLIPDDQNQNHNPSSFSQFSVPFLDTDVDGMLIMRQIFPQQPEQVSNAPATKETKKSIKAVVLPPKKRGSNGTTKALVPRKRTGKKDRHSKIYTSQGPRDRRMRLSLPVARKFFDLQDMLGFDKASKTIEWLITKSTAAIQEVTDNYPGSCSGGNGKTVSSTSENEVLSVDMVTKEEMEAKRERNLRKVSMNCTIPKESREKARARARERTRDKMKMKTDDVQGGNTSDKRELTGQIENEHLERIHSTLDINRRGRAQARETRNESIDHKFDMVDYISEHEMDSVSIIEKFLGISSTAARSVEYQYDLVFSDKMEMQYGFCAMGNEKELSGNGIRVQNPNSISMANPNTQEQNPNSLFMNPSNAFQENDFKFSNFY